MRPSRQAGATREIAMTSAPTDTARAPTPAVTLPRTPPQILGPFYPIGKEPSHSTDLSRIEGHEKQAEGKVLYISGHVRDMFGNPVAGAKITVWQANHRGRYDHPNDDNPEPLDPNFGGFAVIRSSSDGSYRIKTVKPGAYPVGPTSIRPSHVHFEIEGKRERLITQVYFEGDPHHAEDRWLQSARDPNALIAKFVPLSPGMESDALSARFDFVLTHG